MAKLDDYWFTISFSSSASVNELQDNYLIDIAGEVLAHDDSDRRRVAGRLRLFFADLDEATQDGYDPFEVLDLQAATAIFYPVLFDPKTKEFRSGVRRVAGEGIYSTNLLILDRLEILPAYRGGRLGLACLYRCIQQFWHGCGLVALKCFPLQFQGGANREPDGWRRRLKLGALGQEFGGCRSRLETYYGRLGFKKIGREGFMILNPYYVRPGFEELGFSPYAETPRELLDGWR